MALGELDLYIGLCYAWQDWYTLHCRYSRYTLLLDFLLLGLCVIVSAVVCIMMTVAGIVNSNHKSCLTQEGSGYVCKLCYCQTIIAMYSCLCHFSACPDAENLFGYSLVSQNTLTHSLQLVTGALSIMSSDNIMGHTCVFCCHPYH